VKDDGLYFVRKGGAVIVFGGFYSTYAEATLAAAEAKSIGFPVSLIDVRVTVPVEVIPDETIDASSP
jgi:hypothetical protein